MEKAVKKRFSYLALAVLSVMIVLFFSSSVRAEDILCCEPGWACPDGAFTGCCYDTRSTTPQWACADMRGSCPESIEGNAFSIPDPAHCTTDADCYCAPSGDTCCNGLCKDKCGVTPPPPTPPTPTTCRYDANGMSCGGPGAHCSGTGDPACCSGLSCYYNMCLAKASPPAAKCASVKDCGGACTSIVGCEGGECCGRHAYPCGKPPNDATCCEGFHCFESEALGYNYCVADGDGGGETKCESEGHMLCNDIACNIGHNTCLSNPPSKDYTVDSGYRCLFSGTIRNDGCAWKNPATLTISGSGCSQAIKYPDCGTKSFSFTCNPGSVHFSADDSSEITITKSCYTYPGPGTCGNGEITSGEECEPPGGTNDADCSQSTATCQGKLSGIRDLTGNCNSNCLCVDDAFSYSCVKGSCGAGCGVDSDCIDSSPSTNDYCDDGCTCQHIYASTCGNGVIESGEQCEKDSDCVSGKSCSGCRCVLGPVCGDDIVQPGEQCDLGARVNGVLCVPPTNGSCIYCRSNCTWASIGGGSCGDSDIDYGEECDDGSGNGGGCTPDCGDSCIYCGTDCKVKFENGDSCGDDDDGSGDDDYCYNNGGYCLPYPYYYGYGNNRRASVCGDGILGIGEQCDRGKSNGVMCVPGCGDDCDYCNSKCQTVTLQGSPCVRRPRPWDPDAYCRDIAIPPSEARLDPLCGGESRLVTSNVNYSDNVYAKQSACNLEPSSIYLYWRYSDISKGFKNMSFVLEHAEEYSGIQIDYHDGKSWVKACEVYSSKSDAVDICGLSMDRMPDLKNISLRVRVGRTGNQAANEYLDLALLQLTYCNSGSYECGNGVIELNEECDDANTDNGDGCSVICNLEVWQCGQWSACASGQQTQLCTAQGLTKANTKGCGADYTSGFLLLLILIILIVLFLLFPALYALAARKKKKK